MIKALTLVCFLWPASAMAVDVKTYIPDNAYKFAPLLSRSISDLWSDHPYRAYFGGLAEQESCISLKHSRCWSPKSELKTPREQGLGIFQLTRAWNTNGTLRFDALSEMRSKHPELRELSWSNLAERPDLQFAAAVLKVKDDYGKLFMVSNPVERIAFADAAYNGGLGGVQKERRACSLKSGCNPQAWFGNVEKTCLKSRAALYGKRSACDINREHVANVMLVRSPKYKRFMLDVV